MIVISSQELLPASSVTGKKQTGKRKESMRCFFKAYWIGFAISALWIHAQTQDFKGSHEPPRQVLQIAVTEAGKGNVSAALIGIEGSLKRNPNLPEAWYELGSVLGQSGDFEGAEAAFRHAIGIRPDFAKAHYSLAITLVGNSLGKMDWLGAIAECREALRIQPDNAAAMSLLGTGLTATGHMDLAIPFLRRAIRLSPTLAEAHFNLGAALEGNGRISEAASEYREAIKVRKAYPEASSALGDVLFRTGKFDEAERALKDALRVNPDLSSAHFILARTLQKLGRKADASTEFDESEELTARLQNGIQSTNLSNDALELAGKGNLKGAITELRKAIDLKPDYGVPHYNLGLVLADDGDVEEAQSELAKAISLMPGQAKPWFELGRVLERAKKDGLALDAITWASQLAPSDGAIKSELRLLLNSQVAQSDSNDSRLPIRQPPFGSGSDTASDHLAYALKLKGAWDLQGAAGELLRSLRLQPGGLGARRELAAVEQAQGKTDKAVLEYQKILIGSPGSVPDRIALSRLLLEKNDSEGAEAQLRLALHYQPTSVEAAQALDLLEKSPPKP